MTINGIDGEVPPEALAFKLKTHIGWLIAEAIGPPEWHSKYTSYHPPRLEHQAWLPFRETLAGGCGGTPINECCFGAGILSISGRFVPVEDAIPLTPAARKWLSLLPPRPSSIGRVLWS